MRGGRRQGETLRAVARAVAALAVAPLAWTCSRVMGPPVLPHAICAPRRVLQSRSAGRISYYEDASAGGLPVVLIHDLGPTGSTYEHRRLFDALRGERTVLAVDLPGYGFSERRESALTRGIYVAAIEEFLADVARRHDARVDVVAAGRAGELAALAVRSHPELVRSLAIVGSQEMTLVPPARRAHKRLRAAARQALGVSAVARVVYRASATRTLLRLSLARRVAGKIDDGLVGYLNAASRQPRAAFAPVAALSGALTRGDVDEAYEPLAIPTCFVRGEGDVSDRRPVAALVAGHSTFHCTGIPGALELPHVERPRETADALRNFWSELTARPKLRVIRGERSSRSLGTRPRGHVRPVLRRADSGR